jgi:hypothetical protein
VDGSGRIIGYGVFDLDDLTRADWRLGDYNVWSVERALIARPHTPLRSSHRRYQNALRRYREFRAHHPGQAMTGYADRDRWL